MSVLRPELWPRRRFDVFVLRISKTEWETAAATDLHTNKRRSVDYIIYRASNLCPWEFSYGSILSVFMQYQLQMMGDSRTHKISFVAAKKYKKINYCLFLHEENDFLFDVRRQFCNLLFALWCYHHHIQLSIPFLFGLAAMFSTAHPQVQITFFLHSIHFIFLCWQKGGKCSKSK